MAASGAVVLLACLLLLHWYAVTGGSGLSHSPLHERGAVGITGWRAIPTLRWFVLVTVAFGLALALAQAATRGPALPVTVDLFGTLVAGLTTILLAIGLITTGASLRTGAYLGVVAAAATTLGAYRAMRTEQGWAPGADRDVELIALPGDPPPARVRETDA